MSGTTLAKLYSSDAKFQFPYCAWEFNTVVVLPLNITDVSIPILRVGVQL